MFTRALAVPPEERARWLEQACGQDTALRREVELLLDARTVAPERHDGSDAEADQGTTIASSLAPVTERAGDVIGPYKLREQIGEGGFGVVYVADQVRPVTRRVALKIIKLGMDTKQVIARFEAERQALALMDHPNIARVLDAGATETGRPYFVMELVRGTPITEYCDAATLTPRERLELFIPVCNAVQHAHQKGVIHRDLKPGNILVTLHDGRPVPKVIDFGIAKATSARLTDLTIYTEHRAFIGTPAYMSPEQAEMSGLDIDTRSDIYSLGVLLYELLTGTTPFSARELMQAGYGEIQRIIREVDPPRPSQRITTLGDALATTAQRRRVEPARLRLLLRGELDWIVMKAMEKERTRRYETANALALDITRYLSGDPVLAAPPSRTYLMRKMLRRHRGPVVAVSSVGGVMVIGLVGTTIGFAEARSRAAREADANERLARSNRELEAAIAEARYQAYIAAVLAADTALDAGSLVAAQRHLASCDPGERGWEWSHRTLRARDALGEFNPAPHAVLAVRPHADGCTVVTADAGDHTVRLSDVADGTERLVLRGHTARVRGAALSEDGRTIVTSGDDGTARLWDTLTGEGRVLLQIDGASITAVSVSRHGDRAAVVVGRDGTRHALHLVHTARGRAPVTLVQDVQVLTQPHFSPDGARLLAVTERWTVRIWSTDAPAEPVVCTGHTERLFAAAFSPDGRQVLTASGDRTARLWDARTGAEIRRFTGHADELWMAAFSPDGRRVVTASDDRTARIFDTRSGEEIAVMRGHSAPVRAAAFSADGATVLTVSSDRTARLWDPRDGTLRRVLRGHSGEVIAGGFLPGDRQVFTREASGAIRSWSTDAGAAVPDAQVARSAQDDGAGWVAFSPDGARVAVRTRELVVRLHDADSGRLVAVIGHGRAWQAWSPDSRFIATSEIDSDEVRIFDGATGALRVALAGHAGGDRWIRFNAGGSRVLTTSPAHQVTRLWDTETGTVVMALHGTEVDAQSLLFSPDGALLAARSADHAIRTWETGSGREGARCTGHTAAVERRAFNREGTRLLTSSADGTARLWDTSSGGDMATLAFDAAPEVAKFSPDGRVACVAGVVDQVETVVFLDAGSGSETLRVTVPRPQEYYASMNDAVLFHPSGTRALVLTRTEGAVLIDPRTGGRIAAWPIAGLAQSPAAFTPDGRSLLLLRAFDAPRVVDPQDGRTVATFESTPPLRGSAITSVQVSAAGDAVLIGRSDHDAQVFDPATGAVTAALEGTRGWWWPDDVIVGKAQSRYGADVVFDLVTGTRERLQPPGEPRIDSWTTSPDGTRCVFVTDQRIVLLSGIAPGRPMIRPDESHVLWRRARRGAPVIALASSAPRLAMTDGERAAVVVGDVVRADAVEPLPRMDAQPAQIALSPDGRFVATAAPGGPLLVHDAETRDRLAALAEEGAEVTALAFTGATGLAIGRSDGSLTLIDAPTGRLLRALPRLGGPVDALRPIGPGRLAAWAGGVLTLLDPRDGRVVGGFRGMRAPRDLAQVSTADGDRMVVIGEDGSVSLIRSDDGDLRVLLRGAGGAAMDVAITPRGDRVAVASADRMIRVIDAARGDVLSAFGAHEGEIRAIAFLPDGARLASASADGSVRLWHPARGRAVLTLRDLRDPVIVACTADGTSLIAVGQTGALRVWTAEVSGAGP